MRNIIIATIALFFFATATFAQPVQKPRYMVNGKCTPEGAIAYHRVWGEAMGYITPAETAREIETIYRNGIFRSRKVTNSRVDAQSNIIPLKEEFYMVTPLPGSAAGSLFGYPGKTMNLFLKEACGNISWDPPVAPPNDDKGGQVTPPSGAVFCPPKPCDCESMVGEWKHGPETGPCAWKVRKTGMEPCSSCDYTTAWTFYIKWDGSFLYSWTRTYRDGATETGQMHAQPWFTQDIRYIATNTPNW